MDLDWFGWLQIVFDLGVDWWRSCLCVHVNLKILQTKNVNGGLYDTPFSQRLNPVSMSGSKLMT